METPKTDDQAILRDLKMRTNHNGKLDCLKFIHIQPTPKNGIPESIAEKTIFRITTTDNSHPPVYAKVFDSARQTLKDMSATFTLLSHGMEKEEFVAMVLKEIPQTTPDSEMTVYYYKQVPAL